MNLQEELAQNALHSGDIMKQEADKANQRALFEAEYSTRKITESIKTTLLEYVRHGRYTKQYNRGTAECYYRIPNNRYLKFNSASSYNRKHICTSLSYRFDVKAEYATEFEYLSKNLKTWADANQIELSWVVREPARYAEYPFPSQERHPFPPHGMHPVFYLEVKAVTHFPIDPPLTTDHTSEKEIAKQTCKEQIHTAPKEKDITVSNNDYDPSALIYLLFVVLFIVFFVVVLAP